MINREAGFPDQLLRRHGSIRSPGQDHRLSGAGSLAHPALPLPLMRNAHAMSIVNTIALAAIGAIGLNILNGHTGRISWSGAFMAVGATRRHSVEPLWMPFWFGIIAAGAWQPWSARCLAYRHPHQRTLSAIATCSATDHRVTINHVPWIGGGAQS